MTPGAWYPGDTIPPPTCEVHPGAACFKGGTFGDVWRCTACEFEQLRSYVAAVELDLRTYVAAVERTLHSRTEHLA